MATGRTRQKAKNEAGLYHLGPSRIFPAGAWELRYRDGDHRTRRKTFKTKQEALDFKSDVRHDVRSGTWVDPALAMTPFRIVAENWYASPEHDWRPKTRQGHRHMLDRYLLPAFGDRPIGRIQVEDLRAFLKDLPEHLSPTSRRAIYRSLSPIFNQAIVDGMRRVNPVPLVKAPKAKRPPMKALTKEQVEALASAIAPEHRTMVWFMATTGARPGETAALQVKNVNPMQRKVSIERSLADVNVAFSGTGTRTVFGPPKSGKIRSFNIPPFLADMLAAQMAGKAREDLVFTGPQGGPIRWGNFRGRHFRLAVLAALPSDLHDLRIHDLRHTCASILIAAGVHAKAIQEQLGHSSIMVTMDVYGHMLNLDSVANAMEETFGSPAMEAASDAAVTTLRP